MKKKYGILGTGSVAKTIGAKLIQLGHEVKLGSRNPNSENALNWIKNNGLMHQWERLKKQPLLVI